ncbi:hypothetical protein CYMTET_27734, partial [Cymbomonas tetramitiformis]
VMSSEQHGLPVTACNAAGDTALSCALKKVHLAHAQQGVSGGVASDSLGEEARMGREEEVVAALLSYEGVDLALELRASAQRCDLFTARSLFALDPLGMDVCRVPLHPLVASGPAWGLFLRQLLAAGADPNLLASQTGRASGAFGSLREGSCGGLTWWALEGEGGDAGSGGPCTPALHVVAADGAKLARMLLRAGAEVNRCDDDGRTALHVHASNAEVSFELLRCGGDPVLVTRAGESAFDLSSCPVCRKNMVRRAQGSKLRDPSRAHEEAELAQIAAELGSVPRSSGLQVADAITEEDAEAALEAARGARSSQAGDDAGGEELSAELVKLLSTVDMEASFKGAMWELCLAKPAKDALLVLPVPVRLECVQLMSALAKGHRDPLRDTRLEVAEVKLFSSRVDSEACMLWEEGVDFSARCMAYVEVIIVHAVYCPDFARFKTMEAVRQAKLRGAESRMRCHLRVRQEDRKVGADKAGQRIKLPRRYTKVSEAGAGFMDSEDRQGPAPVPSGCVVFAPPALDTEDGRTVQKFITLTPEVANALVKPGAAYALASLPFRCDEAETCHVTDQSPSSTILIGRSGTGKTTVALHRLFERYRNKRAVFVTANRQLVASVQKSFHSLKLEEAPRAVGRRTDLMGTPSEPIFLTLMDFLVAVDGTLAKPFLPRRTGGTELLHPAVVRDSRLDDQLNAHAARRLDEVDFRDPREEDDGAPSDGEDEVQGHPGGGRQQRGRAGVAARPRMVDFRLFSDELWPCIVRKAAGSQAYDAAAVFTEIYSHIKGSPVVLQSSHGQLSLEEYQRLGRKQASSFDAGARSGKQAFGTRQDVYRLFELYEAEKRERGWFDLPDLIHYIWRVLDEEGWRGERIDAIFADEVQDMSPLELKLLLRLCHDKNQLFLGGDTCQTIARGVGFRLVFLIFSRREIQSRRRRTCVPSTDGTC